MLKRQKRASLTPDDVVATVKRSHFPSIIAEGNDDVIVYRRLEEDFSAHSITLIPAGGRNSVLEVFKRRSEFPDNAVVMFIVDRDTWIFSGLPEEYQHSILITTDGYAVENDMFRDGELRSLLSAHQAMTFQSELRTVCKWYAIAVSRHLRGRDERLEVHPNHLLDDPDQQAELLRLEPEEGSTSHLEHEILSTYERTLRGKCLFQLLIRNLSGYSSHVLLNFAASRRGPHYQMIAESVGKLLKSGSGDTT